MIVQLMLGINHSSNFSLRYNLSPHQPAAILHLKTFDLKRKTNHDNFEENKLFLFFSFLFCLNCAQKSTDSSIPTFLQAAAPLGLQMEGTEGARSTEYSNLPVQQFEVGKTQFRRKRFYYGPETLHQLAQKKKEHHSLSTTTIKNPVWIYWRRLSLFKVSRHS